VLASIAALAPLPAAGYILPAEAILSSAARRRDSLGFKTLVVEGFRRRGTAGTADERVWEAILPGTGHRQEVRGPDGTTVTLTLGQRRWVFREGQKSAPAKIRPSLVVSFLAADDKNDTRGFLAAYGISGETVSLSRLDKQAAYVIGAKPWEPNRVQLWIDKTFRVPVRLVEQDGKDLIDTRLLGFGSAMTGEWWPRQIQVFKNGELIETTTYTEVKVNEQLDPALFKPPA
jgi:hypothetical protein